MTLERIINHLRQRIPELEAPTSRNGEIFRAISDRGELSVSVNKNAPDFVDLFFSNNNGGCEILVGAIAPEHVDNLIAKL